MNRWRSRSSTRLLLKCMRDLPSTESVSRIDWAGWKSARPAFSSRSARLTVPPPSTRVALRSIRSSGPCRSGRRSILPMERCGLMANCLRHDPRPRPLALRLQPRGLRNLHLNISMPTIPRCTKPSTERRRNIRVDGVGGLDCVGADFSASAFLLSSSCSLVARACLLARCKSARSTRTDSATSASNRPIARPGRVKTKPARTTPETQTVQTAAAAIHPRIPGLAQPLRPIRRPSFSRFRRTILPPINNSADASR